MQKSRVQTNLISGLVEAFDDSNLRKACTECKDMSQEDLAKVYN